MITKRSLVSVVIVCHNQATNLIRILQSLCKQTLKPYEVVVADDNSYQPIESISKRYGCKYIRTQRGRKLPHIAMRALARELGTFSTAGDIILYLDGDIIPSPYLVELLSAYHSRFQGHVVVKVPRRYRITTEHMLIGNPLYSFHSKKETCLSFEQFTSDCFSVGKDVITNIGGWDTNFIGWGEEDIELAYRFHLAGISIILPEHPLFFCTHIDHSVNHQDNYLSLLRNACYFLLKHPEIGSIRCHLWKSLNDYRFTYGQLLVGAEAQRVGL